MALKDITLNESDINEDVNLILNCMVKSHEALTSDFKQLFSRKKGQIFYENHQIN